MIFSFLLANQIAIMSKKYDSVLIAIKSNKFIFIIYFILLCSLILFSGLRTAYNDTYTYMYGYKIFDMSSVNLSSIFKSYGGFDIYQYLLIKYISSDSQTLIMVSAIITNTIFLWFFSKHSKYFGWTILGYFILGPYIFSMAGIKQILAMSFSLFAIDNLLQNKYVKFVLWILFAMTFHPYIICFLLLPLFTDNIWNRKMIICIVFFVFFAIFLEQFLNIIGIIGKDYSATEMSDHTINPMRVIVEDIPLVLSFLYRKNIEKRNSKLIILGTNMMILNGAFITLGLIANPIYFGRIGTYFALINAVTVPAMLHSILKNGKNFISNMFMYYGFYFIYLLLDMSKLGTINIFKDFFAHISLF